MRSFNGKRHEAECTSEEYASAATMPGPFFDFRRRLWNPRWVPAPFDRRELTYVSFALPKGARWTDGGLAETFDEIVEFSLCPGLARAFVDERLSNPFSGRMRDLADEFADEMPDFFGGLYDVPAPSPERVVVLTAVFLRLYDAATEANVASLPPSGSIGVHSTRRAS